MGDPFGDGGREVGGPGRGSAQVGPLGVPPARSPWQRRSVAACRDPRPEYVDTALRDCMAGRLNGSRERPGALPRPGQSM
jgi:hypothetical protein